MGQKVKMLILYFAGKEKIECIIPIQKIIYTILHDIFLNFNASIL